MRLTGILTESTTGLLRWLQCPPFSRWVVTLRLQPKKNYHKKVDTICINRRKKLISPNNFLLPNQKEFVTSNYTTHCTLCRLYQLALYFTYIQTTDNKHINSFGNMANQ